MVTRRSVLNFLTLTFPFLSSEGEDEIGDDIVELEDVKDIEGVEVDEVEDVKDIEDEVIEDDEVEEVEGVEAADRSRDDEGDGTILEDEPKGAEVGGVWVPGNGEEEALGVLCPDAKSGKAQMESFKGE